MGIRGPISKRSDAKHGHRTFEELATDKAPGAAEVSWPEPDYDWHPIAANWYLSLEQSGQAIFYEPSDVRTAYIIAESMSRDLKEQFLGISEKTGEAIYGSIPMKGASLSAYLKAMSSLLVTEGDRRRAKLELQREVPVDTNVDKAIASLMEQFN